MSTKENNGQLISAELATIKAIIVGKDLKEIRSEIQELREIIGSLSEKTKAQNEEIISLKKENDQLKSAIKDAESNTLLQLNNSNDKLESTFFIEMKKMEEEFQTYKNQENSRIGEIFVQFGKNLK